MNQNFWDGRSVFVTGHTGFIGSWLCLWLQSLGARVAGYALAPPSVPSLFDVGTVGNGMTSLTGDVRDIGRLTSVIADHRPELVLHLAAQPLVRHSYADPVGTYATNVMGTVNLLNAIRSLDRKAAVIIFTSDKCYANREWSWGYRESDELGGSDPYSSSKACTELVTAAYRRAYLSSAGVAIATARAGNAIGGGDWAKDRLIPDAMRALSKGEPVSVRRPDAIRPWQHVLEPLMGCLSLGERLFVDGEPYARAWNFGPPESSALTVARIAHTLIELWGSGSVDLPSPVSGPHEAQYLKLDSSEARSRLGWLPRWSLEQSLAETVSWYRAHHSGKDMRQFTQMQIAHYVNG